MTGPQTGALFVIVFLVGCWIFRAGRRAGIELTCRLIQADLRQGPAMISARELADELQKAIDALRKK